MQNFHIVKEIKPSKSFRTEKIISMFDIDIQKYKEVFTGELLLPDKWSIGAIIGRSGTGKSTIASKLFNIYKQPIFDNRSIIDCMPENKTVEEIIKTFTNVGFSSPPSWLKPFNVLSQGEQMRINIAYSLLDDKDLICFDEYTSVVDRDVAKIMSIVINKIVKQQNKKFVAVTCHSDIIEWLEPDWLFDTNEMKYYEIKKNDQASISNYIKQVQNYGNYLVNITI